MQVRPAYPSDPGHPDGEGGLSVDPRHRVAFRHPGYPDRVSLLFTLHAPDASGGGLHYDTAHTACAIVAGNRWDGVLSETADASAPAAQPPDGILRAHCYYFHVPDYDATRPYPIVPRFTDWLFPHGSLPAAWLAVQPELTPPARIRSSSSAYILSRDMSCRLTGHTDGTEIAHLCPRSEDGWLHRNGMERYILNARRSGFGAIDDASNAILLRADIHHIFDQARFVLVPKSGPSDGEPAIVAHILDGSRSLIRLYQNVALLPLKDVAVEFLFARFAWSIFSFLQGFVCAGVSRTLLVSLEDGSSQERVFGGAECRDLVAPKPRSRSPKKRYLDAVAPDDVIQSATRGRNRTRRQASSPSPSSPERNPDAALEPAIRDRKRTRRQASTPSPSPPKRPEPLGSFASLASSQSPTLGNTSTPSSTPGCSPPPPPPSSIDHLVEGHLRKERLRSDPDNQWGKECEWARDVMARPLAPGEAQRWYAFQGFEVLEEEPDH